MKTLCFVRLYDGQHPFDGGESLPLKSDTEEIWRIWEYTPGNLAAQRVSYVKTKRDYYRKVPVFSKDVFLRWYMRYIVLHMNKERC